MIAMQKSPISSNGKNEWKQLFVIVPPDNKKINIFLKLPIFLLNENQLIISERAVI